MHHALHIEEILLNIFSHCARQRSISKLYSSYANVHLTNLARTCREFKEPALDMIWAELISLAPLVRCLPKELWAKEPELGLYSLKKPLEQTEWDIILRYTHRIRALRLRHSSSLDAYCIKELSNPPVSTDTIFPNLRIVALRDANAALAPLIRHLTNPKVTDISLFRPDILGAAINSFGRRCPFVTDFHVSGWSDSDTISGLVCHWKNLCSVGGYNVLNVDALTHLSRLGNLCDMSLRVHHAVVDRLDATSTLTFSTLRDLCLSSPFLAPIGRLLRHFRVPVMHKLDITVDAAHPTASDLMLFFAALQDACTHASLNTLLLRFYHCDETTPLVENHYINFDRLRPLTVFVNIISITLEIPCGVDLNEREFLALASSWPHLEVFEVGENYDWATSSGITPGGFLQLLERCRSLRVLFCMFDTRGYTEIPQGHPWHGKAMPKNTYLHLLNSPIEEASIEALGVFFHVAPYPDFNLTTHWNNRYFGGSARLYYDRWVEARGMARNLWEERRDLRRSIEARSPQIRT